MNILVTGGTGFVGSNITAALISQGHKVYITGRENFPDDRAILLNTHLTGLDWTELEKKKIDVVYHQAANNNTQSEDEADMFQANYYAPSYMFNMLYRFGCRKYIYASSTAVYGNAPAPYVENVTPTPLTYYGQSKAAFDRFAMGFAKERKEISVIGLRYCNIYGPGEEHKGKRSSMIYQLLNKFYISESFASLYGPNYCPPSLFEFGEQSRDWIYIKDVVKANLLALEHNVNDIYNCGTGVATSFNELVEIINKIKGKNWSVNYIKNTIAETYQNYTCCDITKIQKDLNFNVDYPIESGIAHLISFLDKCLPAAWIVR